MAYINWKNADKYTQTPSPKFTLANITNNLQIFQTQHISIFIWCLKLLPMWQLLSWNLLSLWNLETSRRDMYGYNNMYNKVCCEKQLTAMNIKKKETLDLSWKIIMMDSFWNPNYTELFWDLQKQ